MRPSLYTLLVLLFDFLLVAFAIWFIVEMFISLF